jgi:serine/threonine-protein kinase HipA
MRLARHLRLPVAAIDTITINGRKAIIVERYDRVVHPDRSVERIHQEDFCQALGIPPDKKYEQDGGPSLSRIAVITQGVAGSASLETLLRAVTLNVLIGNGDAHAKNFSLLHNPSGALSLAPLYDLLSTLVYKDDRLAMYIDSVRRTNRVTADRIINEAAEWGLPRSRAAQIIADVLDRAPAAVEAAREETEDVPGDLLRVVETQSDQLRSSFDRRSTHTRSPVQAPARRKR